MRLRAGERPVPEGFAQQFTAYLAPEGFEAQVLAELRSVQSIYGRLVTADGPPQTSHWAQNVWLAPRILEIRSVKDAARQLRAIQRNWVNYSFHLHRRAELIQSELPHVSAKPLEFPARPPLSPLGSWTLLDAEHVLASPACSSPFPNGTPRFVEPLEGPPNLAYLKLWEALTLLGRHPAPGEMCLDAGSAPGGWTWALARLGARVLSVDRAPLAPAVAQLTGVEHRQGNAFQVRPRDSGPFDWIFSDVVCYPERLWTWVEEWLGEGQAGAFVCTLKFQGEEHYGVISQFASVPGSRLVHLSSNKHELTWMRPPDPPLQDTAPSPGDRSPG